MSQAAANRPGARDGERKRGRRSAEREGFVQYKQKPVGAPPTDRAVCRARPAGLGRQLGMTRFNVTLQWTASGKAVYHAAVAEQEEQATSGGRRTFNSINF